MAVLAGADVQLFDSTSYFRKGSRRQIVKRVTMCTFGKPLGKPECKACQYKPSTSVHSEIGRTDFNLIEIRKEQIRTRCAIEEQAVPQYLKLRVGAERYARLEQVATAAGRAFGKPRA